MNQKANRQDFRVVLNGVDLPKEHADQLNAAIQQAALQVIAGLDFGGDKAAVTIKDFRTKGIWVEVLGLPELSAGFNVDKIRQGGFE